MKRFFQVVFIIFLLAASFPFLVVGVHSLSVQRVSAQDVSAQSIVHCGAWSGTPYELHKKGCVRLLEDVYVVDATPCMYYAYVIETFNDYLYEHARVVTSDKLFVESVKRYNCVLEKDGRWSFKQ